ncbi:MAG: DivIVA domain-containing protein [Actinomycetota bacterium]|nr:DivIVA domain-containing protein [Actinomycetota bacterium]
MALERQSIEKKDFPIGRRGYDPDAVDAHLKVLADEIDELKRSSRRRGETLASSASEQVRAIVEAAETSAADIQRQAEEEAREIRAEAASEAHTTREQATSQARDYVSKVSESTAVMLQRIDAMESELGALVESLRTGSNRLGADLQLLEGNLAEVSAAVAPRPQFEPEPVVAVVELEVDEVEPEPIAEPLVAAEALIELDDEPEDEPVAAAAPAPAAAVSGPGEGADDTEGARLIALNMALNGTPREETERYLEENFELPDAGNLLDEVYASVEG